MLRCLEDGVLMEAVACSVHGDGPLLKFESSAKLASWLPKISSVTSTLINDMKKCMLRLDVCEVLPKDVPLSSM